MGLSNEERIQKAAWASNRITNIGHSIQPDSDDFHYGSREYVERIKKLCLELLPAMCGSRGNSVFWLLGSSDEVSSDSSTLWSLALADKIRYAMTPEATEEQKKRREKENQLPFEEQPRNDLEKYYSVKGYLKPQLLLIYDLYEWCQQFQYASNRYDDALSRSYADANAKIALILNECFNIFSRHQEYAVAYLKKEIMPLAFAPKHSSWKNWDVLSRYLSKEHIIFSISSMETASYNPHTLHNLKRRLKWLKDNHDIRSRFIFWARPIADRMHTEKGCSGKAEVKKKSEETVKALCKELRVSYSKYILPHLRESIRDFEESRATQSNSWKEERQWGTDRVLEEMDTFNLLWNREED